MHRTLSVRIRVFLFLFFYFTLFCFLVESHGLIGLFDFFKTVRCLLSLD